jgi:TPR repeat protein
MAAYNLAEDYLDGSGVKRDVNEARHWFALAAEAGYAPAQYKMGWFYSSAEDTPQDLKKAVHWFHLAAEKDEPLAIYALGVMAASGEGLPKDLITADAYLTVSAQHGCAPALGARSELEKTMTADEVRRGRELAGRWKQQPDSVP